MFTAGSPGFGLLSTSKIKGADNSSIQNQLENHNYIASDADSIMQKSYIGTGKDPQYGSVSPTRMNSIMNSFKSQYATSKSSRQ